MPEIPPDHSIVAIKSYRYGTYVTACPDHSSIILKKVDDPNNLPQNCLWTVHRKSLLGYSSFETLKFKSCYGTYLAVKGYIWREICQDKFITHFSKLAFATWTYDQVGTTQVGGASRGQDGFRLMVTQSGYYLCAKDYNQVCLYYSPFFFCTQPEVYWTFHPVGPNDTTRVVPTMPRELGSCPVVDEDDHEHRCGKGITIVNNIGVPVYNHSTVNDSGRNINVHGNQCNGGVIAGNTKLVKNEIAPP